MNLNLKKRRAEFKGAKGLPLIIDIHGSRIADTLSRGLASAA
jgi:hypothetical protein